MNFTLKIGFLAVVLCILDAGQVRAQGVIEGHVKLAKSNAHVGVVEKRYNLTGEPATVRPDPAAAIVYLEGKFELPKNPPKAQMVQKNLDFVNNLLAVSLGTTVEFPNEDDTYHNIFSFSKPKRFDLGRYRSNETPVPFQVFDKPGMVVLHCDIHEHMQAIILVLETPYFQKTDEQGNYRLEHLPPGHYVLKAWLDSKTTLEHEVDITAGSKLRVDFP